MKTNIRRFLMIFLMIIACSGCSLSYRLNQPDESHYKYDGGQNNPVRIQIVDKRHDTDFFIAKSNLANVDLKLQNVDDPILWFSKALQREFSSRGMAVKVDINNTINESDLILAIYQYQIVNYRATGFTPWVSYHLFNGELITGNKNFPVRAYFLYGMVPIWSMTEVQEPCIDMPMSILVKEVASKINHASLHYKLSDEKIEEMNNGINQQLSTNAADACLLILGLGGSNNQNAMKVLHNLSNEEDTLIRA